MNCSFEKSKLDLFKENWGAPYVARHQVAKFSGGLLNPGTMANHDCKGNGPKGNIRIGRNIAYNVEELITWMINRVDFL